ncbi:MAG: DUF1349 domain-containing protein [Oscillospiraceae bacterium]|nr:DUF1349 domain-containing protein [Oscillospiraceae bacterium]
MMPHLSEQNSGLLSFGPRHPAQRPVSASARLQMRICHMFHGKDEIRFGIYACSPEDSAFKACFTNMELTDCRWKAHDGQQPDEE